MKKLIPFLAAALMLAGCGKMTAGTYEPEDLSSQEDGLSSAGADLSSEPAEEIGGVATDGEDTVQEGPAPVTADTGGIVLIYEYTNYAWGFVNNGYFIDSDGNVYGFDLPPAVSYTAKDVPLVEQLKMIKEFSEPALTVDKDTVSKMAGYGAACDPEADFDMELTAFDAGEGRYFFVSPDGETILCGESGDYTYTPKD
ncbi:MAG: hypothetical protein IJ806_11260 [Ruminococcus sp.]|nr:hypothetical protein [Ruminococcus sp.]